MRKSLLAFAFAVVIAPSPESGLKIVTVFEPLDGPQSQTTEYISPTRRRMESPHWAIIIRCDLGQQFQLNLDAREYTSGPQPVEMVMTKQASTGMRETVVVMPQAAPPPPAAEPTITIEVTTTDTGERKQIFGRTARHVITVRKQTASDPNIASSNELKTDGWYIDLDGNVTQCEPSRAASVPFGGSALARSSGEPRQPSPRSPRFVFKEHGAPERGFPLELTYTNSQWPAGRMTQKVTELTNGPLDPALFEVPSGFAHANRWDRVLMRQAAGMWYQFQVQAWQQFQLQVRYLFGLYQ